MNTAFIARTLINAASLWAAVRLIPGVDYSGGWLPFLGVAVVFGVVNAVLGRLMKLLTLPLIVVTLGVFLLVINALLLWLTSTVSLALGIGFVVTGFWAAFWGGLVVSIVSGLLGLAISEPHQVVVVRR
ncbi:MAG: phage holin family protein [Vicinamibacterales bacterium]